MKNKTLLYGLIAIGGYLLWKKYSNKYSCDTCPKSINKMPQIYDTPPPPPTEEEKNKEDFCIKSCGTITPY